MKNRRRNNTITIAFLLEREDLNNTNIHIQIHIPFETQYPIKLARVRKDNYIMYNLIVRLLFC